MDTLKDFLSQNSGSVIIVFSGDEVDFAMFFNSRNIRRKQIPDSILAWRVFLRKTD